MSLFREREECKGFLEGTTFEMQKAGGTGTSATLSGVISGVGALTKTGSGTGGSRAVDVWLVGWLGRARARRRTPSPFTQNCVIENDWFEVKFGVLVEVFHGDAFFLEH